MGWIQHALRGWQVLASWILRKHINRSDVSLLEMGHWSQIQLDFATRPALAAKSDQRQLMRVNSLTPQQVLAGFEKCGSSSLSHNLAKHPEAAIFFTKL